MRESECWVMRIPACSRKTARNHHHQSLSLTLSVRRWTNFQMTSLPHCEGELTAARKAPDHRHRNGDGWDFPLSAASGTAKSKEKQLLTVRWGFSVSQFIRDEKTAGVRFAQWKRERERALEAHLLHCNCITSEWTQSCRLQPLSKWAMHSGSRVLWTEYSSDWLCLV